MFTEMFSPSQPCLNNVTAVADDSTQTNVCSPLEKVRRRAEDMSSDVVVNFVYNDKKKPANKYSKTLMRTVKELSDRHDLVFKGMLDTLRSDENSAFPAFVTVADEIFDDGQINWGRIVAVYTFAARLAESRERSHSERIALFVGKYVANKLGQWILDHGGWDAFVDYFPDQGDFMETIWTVMVFTALGLGVLATMVAL